MAAYEHLLKEKDEEIKQLQIANEALYPSSPGRDDWMKEIDVGPQDPERGEPVFGVDEETGQGFFEFVKQLQINNPKLAGHGMRINDQYVVPSDYKGIREQMDFIPGKGLQFRIDNPDGPPTYRPPTEKELKQYKHEADPNSPLAQISPTDTPRDLRIQDAVKKYGKDPKTGEYIDPTLLIKHLLRA